MAYRRLIYHTVIDYYTVVYDPTHYDEIKDIASVDVTGDDFHEARLARVLRRGPMCDPEDNYF